MKVLKNICIALFVVATLAFATFMILPVDGIAARRAAEKQGYDISSEYKDEANRYYYKRLSKNEKEAYRIIYAQIKDFPKKIVVTSLKDDELEKVFSALSYDNPELFFLGNKCSLTSIGSIYYFIPQYSMTKDAYEKKMSEVLKQAEIINKELASLSTDYEKELFIHDYLVKNCDYDDGTSGTTYTIYGALVENKANCEGYSRAVQYILNGQGITNYLVTGTAIDENGNSQGHMWNIVKIDGKLYNLDATWDDYLLMGAVENPDNTASHIYFNINSKDLSSTHTADDDALWSACTSDSFGYFKKEGLYFTVYDAKTEDAIKQALYKSLAAGNLSLELAFENYDAYNAAFENLTGEKTGRIYNILVWANSKISSDKVDPSRIQYTKDDSKLIIRFFFTK